MITDRIPLKLVIVGDQQVQKAALLDNYVASCLVSDRQIAGYLQKIDYQPNIFENCRVTLKVADKKISLSLCDTSGQQQFQLLRTLAYVDADIVLIAFLVNDKATYINAIQKWYPEVLKNSRRAVVSFVGVTDRQKDSVPESLQQSLSQAQLDFFQGLKEKGCLYFHQNSLDDMGVIVEQCLKQILLRRRATSQKIQCQVCQII